MLRKLSYNLCRCSQISRKTNICHWHWHRQIAISLQQNHQKFSTITNEQFTVKRVPEPATKTDLLYKTLDNGDDDNTALYQCLQTQLRCSANEVVSIIMERPEIKDQSAKTVQDICQYLLDNFVKRRTIIDNAWILGCNLNGIKEKMLAIESIRPNKSDINDFIPFIKASKMQLNAMSKISLSEQTLIQQQHRLYYISDKIKIKPYIVAQYLSKRLFMFTIPFDNLERILNTMIEYKIDPLCILRDLWSFRYSPKVVETRLERARLGQKDRIMPWMVRCTEKVLARTIKNSEDEKALLGQETIVEYVANRLGYTTEITRFILRKHESVFKVRVTKIKDILDYLLNEAGYTPHDIAQNPRILCHSLQTTKQRLIELKTHGCIPTSLVVVCRSSNEYQKFLNTWIDVRKKLSSKNDSSSDSDEDSDSDSK